MTLHRFQGILATTSFSGLHFKLKREGGHWQLRVECMNGVNNITGQASSWNGRWWRLSEHMTDGEVVQTAFKACLTAIEHEAREQFQYKGVTVFDPHFDIDLLVALRGSRGGGLRGRM